MPTSLRIESESGASATEEHSRAWQAFVDYCRNLGHGEIEKLKIQDGVPVMAEIVREKVKFK